MVTKKGTPSWSDVKTKLADFDRAALLGLYKDVSIRRINPPRTFATNSA